MPRYLFKLVEGEVDRQNDGHWLADLAMARREAATTLWEAMKAKPEAIWTAGEVRLEVTNEFGVILFIIQVTTVSAPAGGRPT